MEKEKVFLRASMDSKNENIVIDVDNEITQLEHLVGVALIILSDIQNKFGLNTEVILQLVESELND